MEVLYAGSKYAVGLDSLFESVEDFLRVSNEIIPTHTQDGITSVFPILSEMVSSQGDGSGRSALPVDKIPS